MFSKLQLSTLGLAVSTLLCGSDASAVEVYHNSKRDVCLSYEGSGPTVVHVSTNVVSYPVYLNSYISSNTIININGGVTININNAPTYLNTVVNATRTETLYSTVTTTTTTTALAGSGTLATTSSTTSASATGIAADSPFVIAVIAEAALAKNKRFVQEGYVGFSGDAGTVVSDRGNASLFTSSGAGQLFSGGQPIGLTTAQLATGYGPFEKFASTPDISTTWTVDLNAVVTFTNAAFSFNLNAAFCQTTDSFLFNRYTTQPSFTCVPVLLIAELPTSSNTTTSGTSSASSTAAPTTSASSNSTSATTSISSNSTTATTAISSSSTSATTSSISSTSSTATPTTTSAPTTTPTSSSTSSSSSSTFDPSGDLNVQDAAPTATAQRKYIKKSIPVGNTRRGGVLRSPLKKRA